MDRTSIQEVMVLTMRDSIVFTAMWKSTRPDIVSRGPGLLGLLFVLSLEVSAANGQARNQLEKQFEETAQEILSLTRSSAIRALHQIVVGTGLQSELTDEQKSQIDELRSTWKARADDRLSYGLLFVADYSKYRDLFGPAILPEDIELQREQLRTLKEWTTRMEEILLPHQLKLLEYHQAQERAIARNRKLGMFGIPLGLADELGLDGKQKESLETTINAEIEEFRQKYVQCHRDALKEVLSVIPEEKRKKLESLMGDLSDGGTIDDEER